MNQWMGEAQSVPKPSAETDTAENSKSGFGLGFRAMLDGKRQKKASNRMGELYRKEWDNWMEQFFPIDQKLMRLATGDADNKQAEDFARASTETSFQQSRQADQLHRQGLGTALSADEKAYFDGRSQRNEQAALASNLNSARLHASDRDRQIVSGGLASGLSPSADQGR